MDEDRDPTNGASEQDRPTSGAVAELPGSDPTDHTQYERGTPEYKRALALRAAAARRRNRQAGAADGQGSPATGPEEEGSREAFTVDVRRQEQELAKTSKAKAKAKARPAAKPQSASDAAADANGTIELLSIVGTIVAGPEAAITDQEHAAIHRPLTRIYQRNATVAAAVGRFADPIALLGAIGAYGLRVARSTGAIPPELAARAQAQMHADYASEAATWENFGAAEAPTPPPGRAGLQGQ